MPPKLHSLTSLQKEANSRFGLSARRTLAAAQRLYEGHKVLTYPRTDSSCLPNDYRGHVDEVIATLAGGAMSGTMSEPERVEAVAAAAKKLQGDGLLNQKRNFDDAGVSDHFAIIPTGKMPDSALGGDDAKVFELVVRRFLGSFMGPSKWQKVVRETRIEDAADPAAPHVFYTESNRMTEPGWQLVDRRPPASELLGDLGVEPGTPTSGKVDEIEVEEDATRPPKRYTEAGLLKAMETASDIDLDRYEELEDDEVLKALKDKGLGTPATRADTIEALIAKGYVLRSGKTLRPSAKGITLIDFLERIHADRLAKAELTAEMEFHLHQVETGELPRTKYMEEVRDSGARPGRAPAHLRVRGSDREEEPVGKCPRDGYDVREGLKGYRCVRPARGRQYRLKIKGAGKESPLKLDETTALLEQALQALPGVTDTEPDVKRTNASIVFALESEQEVEPFIESALRALDGKAPEGTLKEPLAMEAVEPDACGYTVWKEFRGRYINRPIATRLPRGEGLRPARRLRLDARRELPRAGEGRRGAEAHLRAGQGLQGPQRRGRDDPGAALLPGRRVALRALSAGQGDDRRDADALRVLGGEGHQDAAHGLPARDDPRRPAAVLRSGDRPYRVDRGLHLAQGARVHRAAGAQAERSPHLRVQAAGAAEEGREEESDQEEGHEEGLQVGMTVRIGMWCVPRTCSTALLRSFVQRADTVGVDEPFYAAYLTVTGKDHPLREEVLASQAQDWRRVVDEVLLAPVDAPVHYQKHMAHHMTPDIDLGFAEQLVNLFLMRDPLEMLPSLQAALGEVEVEDTGFLQQLELYRRLQAAGLPVAAVTRATCSTARRRPCRRSAPSPASRGTRRCCPGSLGGIRSTAYGRRPGTPTWSRRPASARTGRRRRPSPRNCARCSTR